MVQMIGNDAADVLIGDDAIAATLAGVLVGLFQTDITVDRDTTLAELVAGIATFDGYAQEVVTWGPATINDAGEIEFQGLVGEFRPTGSVTPNTIYGYYVQVPGGGGALLFAGRFDNPPLPMGSTLDNIIVTLRWRPQTGGVVEVIT